MKYNDNGEYKDIYIKTFDTLPVGAEVDYDGETVPDGWTQINDIASEQTTAMVGQRFLFNDNFVIYAGTVVIGFTNGQGSFDVTNLKLSARPSCVQATISSENVGIKYDYDNSTSTSLKFTLYNNNAVYSKTGNVRFACTIFGTITN